MANRLIFDVALIRAIRIESELKGKGINPLAFTAAKQLKALALLKENPRTRMEIAFLTESHVNGVNSWVRKMRAKLDKSPFIGSSGKKKCEITGCLSEAITTNPEFFNTESLQKFFNQVIRPNFFVPLDRSYETEC